MQLFGGVDGHLVQLYGVDAISEGLFEIAGKIVAHSVLHGCDGFVGLSPAVVRYIETGSVTKAEQFVTTEDLPDIELKLHNINYVHEANIWFPYETRKLDGVFCFSISLSDLGTLKLLIIKYANYSVWLSYGRHDIIMLTIRLAL